MGGSTWDDAPMDKALQHAYGIAKERGQRLTKEAVARSIAIDFEGRGAPPGGDAPAPDFLGWRIGHKSRELIGRVVTPKLHFLANAVRGRSKGITSGTLQGCVQELIEHATAGERVLLHFSFHEVQMLYRSLNHDLFDAVTAHLADGKPLIERYFKAARPRQHREMASFSLEAAAKSLCPAIQRAQPEVGVGAFFSDVRERIQGRNKPRFGNLTAGQRDKWSTLLEYNFYDLKMLHRCAYKAAAAN